MIMLLVDDMSYLVDDMSYLVDDMAHVHVHTGVGDDVGGNGGVEDCSWCVISTFANPCGCCFFVKFMWLLFL
jgi:hypothetical protein